MSRPLRLAAARADRALPEAAVWLVPPALAPSVTADAAKLGPRRPRIVVEGPCDPASLTGEVAALESDAPVGAFAVQRALALGGQVVVTGPVSAGAPAVGAAAWHHSWRLEDHLHRAAGVLVGAVALLGARGPSTPTLAVDSLGGFELGGVTRSEALAAVLTERGVGPSIPEVEARLDSVYLSATAETVRGWGMTGERGPGRAGRVQLRLRGQVQELPDLPASSRRSMAVEVSESTLPVEAPGAEERRTVPLGELAEAAARDHGDHLVLAVWARQATQWALVEDLVSAERVATLIDPTGRLARTTLPNVSAIRLVASGSRRPDPSSLVARLLSTPVTLGAPD